MNDRGRTLRARIGNLLFGGIGRSVITSAVIGVSLGAGLFWLVLAGGQAHVDRQMYGYQKELASLCDDAPVEVDGQLVRLYRGLVVETPSILGRFDRGQPVGPSAGRAAKPLHLLAETTDQPVGYLKYIVLLHRPGHRPEIDTRLQFCGVTAEDVYWWPQTGYQTGRQGGRIYGEPTGPFATVKWIRDLPVAGG